MTREVRIAGLTDAVAQYVIVLKCAERLRYDVLAVEIRFVLLLKTIHASMVTAHISTMSRSGNCDHDRDHRERPFSNSQ